MSFLGYKTVPENARLFIDQEVSQGRAVSDIRADEQEFQRKILALNKEVAERFPSEELTFFDRGLGDSIAYFTVHRMDPAPAIQAARDIQYRKVFLFDRLASQRNQFGDEQIASEIEAAIERAYTDLGYEITRVPAVSIPERVTLILDTLELEG